MRTDSDEFKAAMLEKRLPPHSGAVPELAPETKPHGKTNLNTAKTPTVHRTSDPNQG